MPQDITLHVKLDRATDVQLKSLAYQRGKSKGQLVREALTACYQTTADDLSITQRNALAAYHGGYISIGRLAHDMGMHVLELRNYLQANPPALFVQSRVEEESLPMTMRHENTARKEG